MSTGLPVSESRLRGGVHWIQPHRVRGWAVAPARPDEAVRIDVWLDARLVGFGVVTPEPAGPQVPGSRPHPFVVTSATALPAGGDGRVVVTATGSDGATLVLDLPRRGAGAAAMRPA